jgi:hypothetical protein
MSKCRTSVPQKDTFCVKCSLGALTFPLNPWRRKQIFAWSASAKVAGLLVSGIEVKVQSPVTKPPRPGETARQRNFFSGSFFFFFPTLPPPPLNLPRPRPFPRPRPLENGTNVTPSGFPASASGVAAAVATFGIKYFGTCFMCGCTRVGCSGLSCFKYSRSFGLSSK